CPVKTKPPTMLPSVTGIWFHSHHSLNVTLAPSNMPVGMMNMLTTACSKPCAKKMKIGIQAVAILPIVEFVPIASTTARQTIQLHRIPLTNAVAKPAAPNAAYPCVLASAIEMMRAATPVGSMDPILVSAMASSAP